MVFLACVSVLCRMPHYRVIKNTQFNSKIGIHRFNYHFSVHINILHLIIITSYYYRINQFFIFTVSFKGLSLNVIKRVPEYLSLKSNKFANEC